MTGAPGNFGFLATLYPALVNSAFAQDGGAQQLDKMLGGELAAVMQDLPSQA